MPALLVGGMLSGLFTPTDAAPVAVVYVLRIGSRRVAKLADMDQARAAAARKPLASATRARGKKILSVKLTLCADKRASGLVV